MTPSPLKGKTFLVVDDQEFLRRMIADALRRLGDTHVIEAADGFEAVQVMGGGSGAKSASEIFSSRPDLAIDIGRKTYMIDCVVTDIRMAPMNGLELLKAIRCGVAGFQRDLPVVIMSAHSDESLIGAAIALDANAFAVKPVSQASLLQKITRSFAVKAAIKDIDHYSSLIVPEVDAAHTLLDASSATSRLQSIRAMDVAMLKGQAAISVPIGELQVDDVLDENVVSGAGALIVPSGTKVSESLLNAFHDLMAITQLPERVRVRRSSM